METLVKVDHLEQIFQECLNHFCYKTDMEVFHKVDYWVGPDEIQADLKKFGMLIGDCDDFASMCRAMSQSEIARSLRLLHHRNQRISLSL